MTVPVTVAPTCKRSQVRLGGLRRLLLEERAARDDDVAAAAFDLGDAKAEALADVLGGIAAAEVDLRRRTEGAQADDLHVEAALVLAGDEPFDGDAVRERLLELAGHVAAAPERPLEDDRAGAAAVVGDRRLELVADGDRDLAGLGVAELGEA